MSIFFIQSSVFELQTSKFRITLEHFLSNARIQTQHFVLDQLRINASHLSFNKPKYLDRDFLFNNYNHNEHNDFNNRIYHNNNKNNNYRNYEKDQFSQTELQIWL